MNNIKNKFFSIISHDLRNTAISINRSVKILADNSPNMSATDCKNFLNELSLTTDTQVELLESLLEWAKIETGKMEFCPAAYDIGQIFEMVEKQLYKLLKDKRISIKSNIADEVCVEADFNMISIVIRNILSNAIKFSYPDSVIDVVVNEIGGDKVLVEIKDYGIGMTEQDIADCFRLDRSVSIKGTAGEVGTGLGLVVCREMLGKHNSVLNITSQRGKGSVFSFTLNKSIKPQ
ncbi:MAG: sensor histidine kinase [Bacteroidota bacterium]